MDRESRLLLAVGEKVREGWSGRLELADTAFYIQTGEQQDPTAQQRELYPVPYDKA